jgi:large subunit ribosomal protein L13e
MHHIKPEVAKSNGKLRKGKGFSIEELKKAGINRAEAKKLEIPVDKRRRTAHDQNVKAVKAFAKKAKVKAKPKSQPKPEKEKKAKKRNRL